VIEKKKSDWQEEKESCGVLAFSNVIGNCQKVHTDCKKVNTKLKLKGGKSPPPNVIFAGVTQRKSACFPKR
jgi:hypothetical protein